MLTVFGEETAEAAEPRSKMRALIRQNSEKIGTFAEDVVLPKHRRSIHRMNSTQYPGHGFLQLQNVESDAIKMDTTSDFTATVAITENKPEKPPRYVPVFMVGLSLFQVVLWCLMNKYNGSPMLIFGYDPHRRYQVWRFFTIMFVHTRLSHLCTNILLQLILGVLLEIVHKWTRIAVIYFASVVGGSLFITLLSPNTYAVGASAGVYGLLFSHLSTIILNWNEMEKKFVRLTMLLFYIIADIGINIYLAPNDLDTNYVGHLGGGITGFLVSILVLKNFERQQWKNTLQLICVAILAGLAVIILLFNIFAWGFYLPTEWNENFGKSYEDFVYQRAITSPEDSAAREYCKNLSKCKILLNRLNFSSFNVTKQSD